MKQLYYYYAVNRNLIEYTVCRIFKPLSSNLQKIKYCQTHVWMTQRKILKK